MTAKKDKHAPSAVFNRGIWGENPVLIHMLGLCPALAVTNTVENSLAMGLATFFVLMCSSILVSSIKRFIPSEVRISTYILIIATFVTVADMSLAAIVPEVHKSLGAFIALIVVNCMILGRQEAFASKNPIGRSALDAAGTGVGFLIAMVMIGTVREVIGMGSFLNIPLFGPDYEKWVVMILPPGGFLPLRGILIFLAWREQKKLDRKATPGPADHQLEEAA